MPRPPGHVGVKNDHHPAPVAGDAALVADPGTTLADLRTITEDGSPAPVARDSALSAEPWRAVVPVAGDSVVGGDLIAALVALEALGAEPIPVGNEDVLVVDVNDVAALVTRAGALGTEPGGFPIAVSGGGVIVIVDPLAALVAVPDALDTVPRGCVVVVAGDDTVDHDSGVALVAEAGAPVAEPGGFSVPVTGDGVLHTLMAPVALDVVNRTLRADPQGSGAAVSVDGD